MNPRFPRFLRAAAPLAAALLLASACGSGTEKKADAAPARGFPVTIDNCGVKTVYQRPPKHAVTLNQHATEIMLALGLQSSMAGTAYLDDAVQPKYEAAYKGVKVLAEEYPSYETLLAAEPDFVYGGFASAFADKEGRGRAALKSAGIDTRLNLENCAKPVTTATLDTEIREVGKTFGVANRAEREISGLHETLDGVRAKLGNVAPVKVAVYDSGEKTAFTAGGAGIGNEMIRLAGATNVFGDLDKTFGDVSFEQFAERAPDAIVIYDYGDQSVEDKKRFLLSNPALKDVPAIRNRRFAVLPLSSTVLGVRVPAAVESLARALHPDRFA
ncbi:ABC transporter substrate-binding protein [Actinomadura atramentaria]|uniref:ABC transporter substrate-binding protein n=1 Tax=Actinomadura atramentaria TaxID=1990 RepID=UPI000369991D|nr:ABC transporter substrate-binding protein [Actinomadura atramentaria]